MKSCLQEEMNKQQLNGRHDIHRVCKGSWLLGLAQQSGRTWLTAYLPKHYANMTQFPQSCRTATLSTFYHHRLSSCATFKVSHDGALGEHRMIVDSNLADLEKQ
jgi:hypothetical protein